MTEWANIMTFRQEPTPQLAEKGLFLRVQRSFGQARKMRTPWAPFWQPTVVPKFRQPYRRNDFTKRKIKFISGK